MNIAIMLSPTPGTMFHCGNGYVFCGENDDLFLNTNLDDLQRLHDALGKKLAELKQRREVA